MQKLIILTIFSFIFFDSIAQKNESNLPYRYLKISEGEVIWEKIDTLNNLKAAEIESLLINLLSTISGIENVKKIGEVITFDILNVKVDYKKYGGTVMGTAIFLNHPMFAKGFAQIKDGKYRLVIKGIYFMVNLPSANIYNQKVTIEEALTKKKVTEFSLKEININSGQYIENYFEDMLKKKSIKSDW